MAKVVNIRKKYLVKQGYENLKDWLKDPNHVYIGRKNRFVEGTYNSKWANPFSVKRFGREKCIELYKKYLLENISLLADLPELEGKTLGCWCHPEKCHGDVLIDLLSF